jgi:lysophospholipase L1-like esterase
MRFFFREFHRALRLSLVMALLILAYSADAQDLKFIFATGDVPEGATPVQAQTLYSVEQGYGFEPGAKLQVCEGGHGGLCSKEPFYFSAALPEGNYRVTLSFSDAPENVGTTVKAELRRLMLEGAATSAAGSKRTFIVNIRRPQIAGASGEVRLKPRERAEEAWAWDEKLTLEFNGTHPSVSAIEISRADELPTLFILGDSTVADQPREPYASWGQMLTRFFSPDIALANHSESGESAASALSERRVEKLLSVVRPGDWLLLQFGHNDMKKDDVATYQANLRKITAAFAAKKVSVILVTPMHRHTFGPDGKIINSHKNYPDAVQEIARDEHLPLIDLLSMSQAFYEALGEEKSLLAFKPGDSTHHDPYGAYELAKCVVEGIRSEVPALAKYIPADLPPFDPAKPDAPETFSLPPSPTVAAAKPDGS